MATVGERVRDGAVLARIKQWRKAPVVEEDEKGNTRVSGGKANRTELPCRYSKQLGYADHLIGFTCSRMMAGGLMAGEIVDQSRGEWRFPIR